MGEADGEREGKNLLGSPSYTELSNGRFKCVETGHELPGKEMESYGNSKRCRLGMIEFALKSKKPPLNMFKRDPNNSSKLICKLTRDVVNKSEEHIWKHLNGKRFLNKLELKEMGKLVPNGGKAKAGGDEKIVGESDDKKKRKKKKRKKREKKKLKNEVEGGVEVSGNHKENEELDFWVPPAGSRWDNDEGGDRWGSDSESGEDSGSKDVEFQDVDDDEIVELPELSRSKRAHDGIESGSSKKKDNMAIH